MVFNYFRVDIPNDLSHYFPVSEIKRSLKTKDLDAAKKREIRKAILVFSYARAVASLRQVPHERRRADTNCEEANISP
ncbi:DUF6538 domain-containing protein [Geobacter sp. SVR]|uniref:DUF6538 domain-containing protein n=1 Tax=Geobacter sp. SVR TaxID=2495594 RepID=UPI00351C9A73